MIMIKVPGKGRVCIPEGHTKACETHGPTNDLYINFAIFYSYSILVCDCAIALKMKVSSVKISRLVSSTM